MDSRFDTFKEKFNKTYENLKSEYAVIRAGRANPKILDRVMVSYYGTMTPLPQMAGINVPEARIIIITPYDKTAIKEIVKSINESDIGINPVVNGDQIQLTFPELNEERRKEISKDIKKLSEDSKVALRNIRRDANDFIKKLKNNNEATEDDVKTLTDDIQKMLDDYIKKVDNELEKKVNEIMKV